MKPLTLYVRLVAAAGACIVAGSLATLYISPPPREWLLFAALAVVSGAFSMKITAVSASVTVSDTFFFATAMLFGPAPATAALALDTAIVSSRRRHGPSRMAFNIATGVAAMWTGSRVFFFLSGMPPLADMRASASVLVLPLVAFASVYFALNSGLTAVAIGLDTRRSPFTIWRQHFMWLSLNCFASASIGFCLMMLYQVSIVAVVVALPLMAVLHLTLRSSFGRLEDARTHLAHLDRLYVSTVETLAMAIDAKDDVTHSHVRRVQTYALGLARALEVSDEPTLKAIEAAALLHDTGKLAVPEHILNKPGKLTPAEFDQMKRHVDIGADILSLVEFPFPVVPIVRCHHENWDGSGYPRGIKGTDIPIGARILSVVDCFDALTSDRPYRAALTDDQAFQILRERSGTMYEPRVVDAFIRVHGELARGIVEHPAHRSVLQQISRAKTALPTASGSPAMELSRADEMHAFVSLARLASGDGSLADVLGVASALVAGVAPNVTIAWYLHEANTQSLSVIHAAGPNAELVRSMSMRLGEGLSGWVAAHRQPIVNSEAALDLGRGATGTLRSCLSVPLITRDSVLGALTCYSDQAVSFSQDQSRVLQVLAPHLAQAIWVTQGRSHARALRLVSAG